MRLDSALRPLSRRTLLACTLTLLAGGVARAAPDITLDGMIRSYSRMVVLADVCPAVYPMDAGLARRYGAAFKDVVLKAGGTKAEAALVPELRRRRMEVQATGSPQWCTETRDSLRQLGAGNIFK